MMKTSIQKLFSALQFNTVLLIVFTMLIGGILLSATAVFQRIDNLASQESLLQKVLLLDRNDREFSRIGLTGMTQQLSLLIELLDTHYFYEFVNDFYIQDTAQRRELIQKTELRYDRFVKDADAYINTEGDLLGKRAALQKSTEDYSLALQPLLELQSRALYRLFLLISGSIGLVLVWAVMLFLSGKRVSRIVQNDLNALARQEGPRPAYHYKTIEISSLAHKWRQQSSETIVPSQQDLLTQLYNYEGLQRAFNQRYAKGKSTNVYLCLFEIDNFIKLTNHYPESVLEPILLKITSILKLFRQQNDLLARIDDDKFLAVFVRADKTKALEEFNHIRQMVEENRFKLPHAAIPITLSGGFTAKTSSQTLDDAMKNAKEYLAIATGKGGNVIAELKDNTRVI